MATIGVAVAVPEPWGSRLQDYRTALGDEAASRIPTHITLLPPMQLEDGELSLVEKHLAAVAGELAAYRVHLRDTGTFRPVSPVVFVALAEGIAQTELLAAAVRSGPLALQLPFPFHPHVTVAHDVDDELLDRAFADLAGFDCQFEVADFSLYVHHSGDGWRVRRRFALGGPENWPVAAGRED